MMRGIANPSVAPAVLVDLGLEALRHARLLAIFRNIAKRAGHSGCAAVARARAGPRRPRMLLAYPAKIQTLQAPCRHAFLPPDLALAGRRARHVAHPKAGASYLPLHAGPTT